MSCSNCEQMAAQIAAQITAHQGAEERCAIATKERLDARRERDGVIADLKRASDRAQVLEWALRRAVDRIARVYGPHSLTALEITKILADNGLAYGADGKLVEREGER